VRSIDIAQAARKSGDPAPLLAAAAELPPEARSERAFLVALARLLGSDAPLEPTDVDGEAALLVARELLVRLEPDQARVWLERAPRTFGRAELEAWCAILEGGEADVPFEALRRDARAEGRSAEVVELTGLEALGRLESDPTQAETIARRAARMAATEELPDSAFLANAVLARVRRITGRPHLATHILATLVRYAPRPWRTWLGWELTMSFGRAGASLVESAGGVAVRAVERASEGSIERAPAMHHRDLVAIAALCSPWGDAADDAVLAFRRGTLHSVPRGLHGVAAVESQGAVAWVAAGVHARGARALALGLPRLEREGLTRLPQSHRHRGRIETLLAACALAGDEGIEEHALFEACYGFAYDPGLHAGPLGVAVHRARQRVGDLGAIDRAGGRIRLSVRAPILLPDPRCAVGTEDRALQHIALGGTASARSLADALGVSLRSAQQALESLVQAGLCARERERSSVLYRVEDTTFHEPTQIQRPPRRDA
jgi:hypothetical protein